MGRFDRQIETAKRLIKQNGQLVTWRRVTDGSPVSPSEPWKPGAPTYTDVPVYIVFIPEDRRNAEFLSALSGTSVPKGKLVGYMAAQDFVPTLKDVVLRDGETIGVRTLDPLAPNGQVIMYTIRFDL